MKNNYNEWINKAEEDFQTCEILLSQESFPPGVVCYHSQQLAEKYLKAFLNYNNFEFKRTHDLIDLIDNYCRQLDKDFKTIRENALELTDYSVMVRYPGDMAYVTSREAYEAFENAKVIKDFIKGKIES